MVTAATAIAPLPSLSSARAESVERKGIDIAPKEQIENGQGDPSEAIAARLEELRAEFKAGEKQMEELEKRRAQLRDTLLRISGAIQVLEEMLPPDSQ